jgi:hypothetical protein
MLTREKLNEFAEFHGLYDGFYMQKVKNGIGISSDDEWALMSSLIQDWRLVKRHLTSEEFAKKLDERLKVNCDSFETISMLKNIANEPWVG